MDTTKTPATLALTATTFYAILIRAGRPGGYGPRVGWDDLHTTRRGAEAQANRARAHGGWAAKVISMSREEAIQNGWLAESAGLPSHREP
jgi:hypothetical protein